MPIVWQTARLYTQVWFVSYLFSEVGFVWSDSWGKKVKLVIESAGGIC